jgi:hypothetical protein
MKQTSGHENGHRPDSILIPFSAKNIVMLILCAISTRTVRENQLKSENRMFDWISEPITEPVDNISAQSIAVPDKLVVLTFDDADVSQIDNVAPLLKKKWLWWNIFCL